MVSDLAYVLLVVMYFCSRCCFCFKQHEKYNSKFKRMLKITKLVGKKINSNYICKK